MRLFSVSVFMSSLVSPPAHEKPGETAAGKPALQDARAGTALNDVLKRLNPNGTAGRRADCFRMAGGKMIEAAGEKDRAATEWRVAAGWARNNVLLDEALARARRAAEALTPRSPVDRVREAMRVYLDGVTTAQPASVRDPLKAAYLNAEP
jgi:hypothetical protein